MRGVMRQSWYDSITSVKNYYWYEVQYGSGSNPHFIGTYVGYTSEGNAEELLNQGFIRAGQFVNSNVSTAVYPGAITFYNNQGTNKTLVNTLGDENGTIIYSAAVSNNDTVYTVSTHDEVSAGRVLTTFTPTGTLLSQANINFVTGPFNSDGQLSSLTASQVALVTANAISVISPSNTITMTTCFTLGTVSGQNIMSPVSDSGGNIYFIYTAGGFPGLTYLVKITSTGTISWQKQIISSYGPEVANELAIDSAGNLYTLGYSGRITILLQFNSSGTLTYEKLISFNADVSNSNSYLAQKLFIDAKDNIYITGTGGISNSGTVLDIGPIIVKLNTAGNVQFSNGLFTGNSSITSVGTGFVSDIGNTMMLSIGTNESYIWTLSLPADGSYTGNTFVNGLGGGSFNYISLSNVVSTIGSNVSTTTGNLGTTSATRTISGSPNYTYVNQPMISVLTNLGTS